VTKTQKNMDEKASSSSSSGGRESQEEGQKGPPVLVKECNPFLMSFVLICFYFLINQEADTSDDERDDGKSAKRHRTSEWRVKMDEKTNTQKKIEREAKDARAVYLKVKIDYWLGEMKKDKEGFQATM